MDMQTNEDRRLYKIIIELEKKYPFFKKMDIYSTVKDAYKKVCIIIKSRGDAEFDQVKKIADLDLGLS
jgi:hypothetical protein